MGMWHFGGEEHIDDNMPFTPSIRPSVEKHSCSICKHFTSNLDNLCLINPEVVKRRIEYHESANIFSCDLTIPCDLFERDYTKMWGYIK